MLSAVYFLSFIFFRFEIKGGLGREDFYLTEQALFSYIIIPKTDNLVKENNPFFRIKKVGLMNQKKVKNKT